MLLWGEVLLESSRRQWKQIVSVEAALCRRWGITAVLARQSGGPPEQQWHAICAHQGLKLLLLQRPLERATSAMTGQQLLAHIGSPG